MTKPTKPGPDQGFVSSKLPWVIAGAAAIVYLLTMNHWVSFGNLTLVAKTSGWIWGPDLYNPLFFLVTYPFRWLPANLIPIAFNLLSLVCGALSLALLARSVALLPHDRTQDQRLREKSRLSLLSIPSAWVPPVLAALVCGLQITFWESATSGAGDLFDLLLFAYVIRNLLEFRINGADSWLYRAALVCGAAMANNWVMFCLFPAFMVAMIWIKGFAFFNGKFLLRASLFGLAGLLLYLLLPTIHVLSDQPMFTFWQALKSNLAVDKQAFLHFLKGAPINARLLLATTSLLPILVIGIRWASNFGDPSRMGSNLATWILHLAHGALLVLGIWIAFDPVFSPRQLSYAVPAFYYLSALSVGYFSGYFLLVFKPLPDRMGRTTPLQVWAHKISRAVILSLVVLLPIGLLARNLSQVRMTNGSAIKDYATQLIQSLPERSVVLSDDSRKLYLAESALTRAGRSQNYIFLDTAMLTIPGYHAFQQKLHPKEFPVVVDTKSQEKIEGRPLINLLFKLSQTNAVYYLHPSFGYYFEVFKQRPHGLSHELQLYPTNSLSGPPLTDQEVAANEKFWSQAQSAVDRLQSFITPPAASTNASFKEILLKKFHLPFERNATALALGSFYSQALDSWGVQLQRLGKLDRAQDCFQSAVGLFGDNLAAQSNLAFNRDLRAGRPGEIRNPRSLEEELGKYRSWEQVLRDTGPFDDPTHCFGIGLAFAQGNLFRQAAQQVERAQEIVPDNVQASFWLARLYIMNQMPQAARKLLADLRDDADALAAVGIRRVDFLQTEVTSLFVDGQTDAANRMLQTAVQQNPKDADVLAAVTQISSVFKSYTNALLAVDQLLKLRPDDVPTLVTKGAINIQAGNFTAAIPPLDRALSLQSTNYGAQLYRAVALLRDEKFDEAKKDYDALQKIFPNSNEVNGGLGEIAWRQHETNTAIRYYELCLKNTRPGTEQAKFLSDRLASLKPSTNSP